MVRRSGESWERSLVGVPELCAALDIDRDEAARWIADGRIPIARERTLARFGQPVTVTLHDPARFDQLLDCIPGWRAADAAQRSTAGATLRRLRRLVRAARLRDIAVYRDDPAGFVIAGEDEIAAGPDGTLPVACRWAALLPAELVQAAEDGEPVEPLRTAVDRWRALVGAAVDRAMAHIAERADGFLAVYPDAAAGRFAPHLERAWRQARGQPPELELHGADLAPVDGGEPAGVERLAPFVVQALSPRLDRAIESFARTEAAAQLRHRSGLADYPALFPVARGLGRRLRLLVGPTNSGKTHAAMRRLAAAESGVYAAPLRLMALEAYERLADGDGVACAMVTGEERIDTPGARHLACTIETVNLDRPVEVAVIDEIQMLGDADRGWAWTQALIGLPAAEIVMTGSLDAVPWVMNIARQTGEDVEVETFERKSPLRPLVRPVRLGEATAGDALIAFSRADVMRLRAALLDRGHRVAAIYGALGPEVRRAEARRFRSGDADLIVATDAIGMGLNLPIRRVLFSTLAKFDGTTDRMLTGSEIRQIAGRAGRFGHHEEGWAGVLAESGETGEPVAEALATRPAAPRDVRPFVMPPRRAIEAAAELLGTDRLSRILRFFAAEVLADDPALRVADLDGPCAIADAIQRSGLPLGIRIGYLGVPVDVRDERALQDLAEWAWRHAHGEMARPTLGPGRGADAVPASDRELARAEVAAKRITGYLWLSMRWPETYACRDEALAERDRLAGLIERALQRRVAERSCRRCGTPLPPAGPPICLACRRGKRRQAAQ